MNGFDQALQSSAAVKAAVLYIDSGRSPQTRTTTDSSRGVDRLSEDIRRLRVVRIANLLVLDWGTRHPRLPMGDIINVGVSER